MQRATLFPGTCLRVREELPDVRGLNTGTDFFEPELY